MTNFAALKEQVDEQFILKLIDNCGYIRTSYKKGFMDERMEEWIRNAMTLIDMLGELTIKEGDNDE